MMLFHFFKVRDQIYFKQVIYNGVVHIQVLKSSLSINTWLAKCQCFYKAKCEVHTVVKLCWLGTRSIQFEYVLTQNVFDSRFVC